MASPSLQQLATDYQTLNQGAGLVDLGPRTQIELSGEDRHKFLHGFCTNQVEQLQPGAGCEAFLTSLQGKIVGHVLIFCCSKSLVLETTAGQAEGLINHLDRYIIQADVTLLDQSAPWQQWLLGGQQAAALLSQELAVPLPENPLDHVTAQWQSIPIAIRKIPRSRNDSFVINCPQDQAAAIESMLLAAGSTRCLHEAAEVCRIETGFPAYSQDITEDNLPQEIDRNEQAINFTKGCYLGQETVARIDALGHVNRKLRGLRFDSATVPPPGSEISVDGKRAALVTSSCYCPAYESALALGFVQRGYDDPGQILESPTGTATVSALPFEIP